LITGARRLLIIGICTWLASACIQVGAELDAAQVQRISAVILERIASYEAFVDELRLQHVPQRFEGRVQAMILVDELGARLEQLSRQAGGMQDASGVALLEAEVESFDEQLLSARQQTRRVAICGLRRWQGAKRPTWGVAQGEAGEPVYPPVSQFAGKVAPVLELTAAPGETAQRQVVVISLKDSLQSVTVRVKGPLKGPAGKLPSEIVQVLPVIWSLPDEESDGPTVSALEPGPVDVPYDVAQPFMVTVEVPADSAPGLYRTRLVFQATGREKVSLRLELEVSK